MRLFHIDSFTDRALGGAAAPVVVSGEPVPLDRALALAGEFNQPVLTILRPTTAGCEVRYFEKSGEVGHVGHAGLAAAYVALNYVHPDRHQLALANPIGGDINVERDGELVALDTAAMPGTSVEWIENLDAALGNIPILERLSASFGSVAVLENEEAVRAARPDFVKALQVAGATIIVTAAGRTADFVSRVFAPKENLPEDPVCGTAHRILVPYWSAKLGRTHLSAHQLSEREGVFRCSILGDRVRLAGSAAVLFEAELSL